MASSSSFSRNWKYDVFVSFRGKDVRKTFLSHFLKELDRKLITFFIDNEIDKGQSLDPVLKEAIRTSRIAVVVFSENYASSSWCLDELVEIVKCKEELVIIPTFYHLDPTDVRNQTGKFGEVFAETCVRKSENEKKLWQQSLFEVANLCGNHHQNWPNEAKMVEEIVNDVLGKLLNLIPRNEFEDFVGMEDHIAEMNALLDLESEDVRMVGIWGTSGIGKTSIARTLYSQLSRLFESKIFIDKAFVMKKYESANPSDPNVKLHLVRSFLSEILDKKDIKIDSFDAMRRMLKHHKVLIFIDDLDHQEVLNTLVGQIQWFGRGSRIIVITKDKHFLRAHGIDHIYEVRLPSDELALKIFCKSAFGNYLPPDGLMEFASKMSLSAGNLPLGLHVLGSYVKGRKKEYLFEILPSLLKDLNGDIMATLRVSYDGIGNENLKTIFRHIACLFNGERVNDVKLLLADSNIDVIIGLENLVDKSLIRMEEGIIEMHSLLQKMGKEIVRAQSNKPGKREFLVGAKEICAVLENNTGTSKVLGITLDTDEMDEPHILESALKKMPNLCFLKVYTKKRYLKTLTTKWDKEWHLPQRLRWLRFDNYPGRCMLSSFCLENLVKLDMAYSKLERLWERAPTFRVLQEIDLSGSIYLKEIPDLSKASNLQKLDLSSCSSLVELPSSIKYLNKLKELDMGGCMSLETLPNGINLQSLDTLNLLYCLRLNSFPDISTNISELWVSGNFRKTSETLWARAQPYSLKHLSLSNILSLVEIPSSIKNFNQLEKLDIYCINLETLPTDINFCSLRVLHVRGCSRLRIFPNISTNIEELDISQTGIEEVPWWIENFTKLKTITTRECSNLVHVSLNIYKLKLLEEADFLDCNALSEASWNDHPIAVDEVLSSVEVPLHFIHQTTAYSLTNIPLHPSSLSQQLFKFRACVVVVFDSKYLGMDIDVRCEFKDRFGNSFLWVSKNKVFIRYGWDSVVFVLDSPLDECNAIQAQLNYDHVDMEIHIGDSRLKLKRWGVEVLDVCEENSVSESEHNEECIQTVGKRQRETGSLDFWGIKKTIRVSYNGLDNENHKAIFRHIACLFNGERVSDVKLLLADSDIDVIIGLENLVDKHLIRMEEGIIKMHYLLQKMGKEIVRAQSSDPGKQEFLVGAKEICAVIENNTGTSKVLGIALDIDEMDKPHIFESALKKMPNLRFLKVYNKEWYQKTAKWDKEWHFPQRLRWLRFDNYPGRCMAASFCLENLVKLEMRGSKLERLWEGTPTLRGLKEIDLNRSRYLKEIPNLSKASNLKKLNLGRCSSLVELPSSIKYLNKLEYLDMEGCSSLEILPNGINLQSLDYLNLIDCPRLKSFPDISTNTSSLFLGQEGTNEVHFNLSGGNIGMNRISSETLWVRTQPYSLKHLRLSNIPSLVEIPSSTKNFNQLEKLDIIDCINLETLPTDINFCSLRVLYVWGCSRLKIFPNISTNIEELDLSQTGIEEVPWWIENFTKLKTITMRECSNLVHVSLNIYKLKLLEEADFLDCKALSEASWNDHPIAIDEVLSSVEVPLHFIHQTTGYSLTNIPLLHTSLSQQLVKLKACVVVVLCSQDFYCHSDIVVSCEFKDRLGNSILWVSNTKVVIEFKKDSVVFVLDSLIPLDECNATQSQLNYDHVDMEIHIGDSQLKLKRWGVELLDVCEDNSDSESEHNEECIQTNVKRQRETGSQDLWEIPCMKRQDTSTYKCHDFIH